MLSNIRFQLIFFYASAFMAFAFTACEEDSSSQVPSSSEDQLSSKVEENYETGGAMSESISDSDMMIDLAEGGSSTPDALIPEERPPLERESWLMIMLMMFFEHLISLSPLINRGRGVLVLGSLATLCFTFEQFMPYGRENILS